MLLIATETFFLEENNCTLRKYSTIKKDSVLRIPKQNFWKGTFTDAYNMSEDFYIVCYFLLEMYKDWEPHN